MANWKLLGIVPDSDEEEELDSQSNEFFQGYNHGIQNDENQPSGPAKKEALGLEDLDEEHAELDGLARNFEEPISIDDKPPILEVPSPLVSVSGGIFFNPTGPGIEISPESPPDIIQTPESLLKYGEEDQNDDQLELPAINDVLPFEEEISRSYVHITSPKSSQLSSPPASELSLSPIPWVSRQAESPTAPEQQRNADTVANALNEPALPYGRRFRERKPIQLHPYVVENEKYRRTVKAGGMAPLRLASSQDDGRRTSHNSRSLNQDSSQQEVSQYSDMVAGEGDAMDTDWDVPSSSPPSVIGHADVNLRKKGREHEEDDEDDEDDLPNLDELLRRRQDLLPGVRTKKVKSYSTKYKRHGLPRIQTQSHSVEDIFNVPASPPVTSSPYPINPRRVRSSLSRLGSVSSTMQTPNLSHHNTPISREKTTLPTPATSVSRAALLPPLSDSSSESEAPLAEGPDDTTMSSSSSDEDIAIRKISRKIRGVLPASHLRLNQQNKPRPTIHNRRESPSLSPVKGVARRGIALPRFHEEEPIHLSPLSTLFPYLSNDSEEDGSDNEGSAIGDSEQGAGLEEDLGSFRLGFAEEGDHVDAMLPSRKRLSSGSKHESNKKRRLGISSDANRNTPRERHPRITEHTSKPRKSNGNGKASYQIESSKGKPEHRRNRVLKRPSYPRLGILDLPDNNDRSNLPNFLKVAARTVRHKKGQGRQSPSRKFIRLATREDTEDVQSVLDDWRGGRIQAHRHSTALLNGKEQSRNLLQQIYHNSESMLPDSVSHTRASQSHNASVPAMPRKIHIARIHQQSIEGFVSREHEVKQRPDFHAKSRNADTPQNSRTRQRKQVHPARPAQLESSEFECPRGHSTTNFRSTKKILDALYRKNRRRPIPQANVQLSRFLEDEDVVKQSVESDPIIIDLEPQEPHLLSAKALRVKKRIPQRLDAGAARYRQPSNPLILDYFVTAQTSVSGDVNTKLTGLGSLGTRYTSHFNIFPLQLGIFFHQDTLIGQGRLNETLRDPIPFDSDRIRPRNILRLGEKTFIWGEWDEVVSSELGLCFDWIVEQLMPTSAGILASNTDVVNVLSSVLDYVRNHSSCKGSLNLKSFLARLMEILGDFSSRLRTGRKVTSQDAAIHIDVLSVCMLLITRLLRLARASAELSIAWEIEERMKDIADFFVEILLAQGFDSVHKLYDDLQYLSFRESGIKRDQYIAQAWVVLIKTLAAANISRGSFWDVVGPHLLQCMQNVTDAQVLEKAWYCMFSLLPLCEFNDFGFTAPGTRQTSSFDGWRIPQQLIKQVTSLYEKNQKQPPGFNDYCRSLFARCHCLITDWGWWKCTPVIGSLFDFFASQQLAHLRNEEANHSPQFLSELDREPALDIEPEDRCFHIFLKMVALVIKHLANTKDTKTIRNLVARLLPNHNRQFSKNEAIRQRDIASLRNHHDLLCTMYWAAPVKERPAVALFQELVVSSQSHNEACLINLRSWESLARFVVATSVDVASFEHLKQWQTIFFSGLCQQYLGQEDEIRQQTELLQHTEGEPMTESRILETVITNMRSTMVPMCVSMAAMGSTMQVAKSNIMLKQALNSDVLGMALDQAIHVKPLLAESLISACLRVLDSYVDKVNDLYPTHTVGLDSGTFEADSQDSLDMAAFAHIWERSELASCLQYSVLDSLSSALRKYLERSAEDTKEPMLIYRFVECWARLVSLVTENKTERVELQLESFLIRGKYAVFENRESYKVANDYWPLFLARLLQSNILLDDFKLPGFNMSLEWLISLLKPQALGGPERNLSKELFLKGHYLCSHVDLHTSNRIYMIEGAVRKMSSLLIDKTTNTEIGMTQREAERLFSDILKDMMRTMQKSLESLDPLSEIHKDFVEIVQLIVADIKCYASDIVPLIDFFVHPSTYYWPPDTDPTLFEAGIVSYCIRLGSQPGKTSVGLFYFLLSGWQKALISSSMANYLKCIKKSMKRWDFCKFMLAEFLPAVVGAGFSADGWVLCSTFLPPLAIRAAHLLESRDHQSEWVFEHLVNMLRIIMNGVITQHRKLGGTQPSNRGIIAVAIKFWLSIAAPMRQFIERYPEKTETLSEVADPLTHFIWYALQSFKSDEPEFWYPTGQLDVRKGKHYDDFVAALEKDIKDSWEFEDTVGEKVIIKAARSNETSPVQWFGVSLKAILDREIAIYLVLFPSAHEVPLSNGSRYFTDGLYV